MLTDNAKYGRLTAVLLIVWLAISITASKLLIFQAGSKYAVFPPGPLGLAVLLPIASFLLWFAVSGRFRQFALSLAGQVERGAKRALCAANYPCFQFIQDRTICQCAGHFSACTFWVC